MAVNAGPEGRLLVTTDTTWPLRFSGRQRLVLFVLLGAGVHAVGGRRVGGRALRGAFGQPRGGGRRGIGEGPGGPPAGVPRLRPRGEPHTPAAAAGRRLASGAAARTRLAGCRAQALRVSARSWTRTHGFQRRRNHWFPTRMEAIMMDEAKNGAAGTPAMPVVADRAVFEAELDALRVREKAHTREGDAIAAARRAADLAGGVRGAPAAHRLLLHVASRPAGGRAVRRLHVEQHPDRRAVLPAFPRHHLRGLVPGSLRAERPLPRLHGLGPAVVLSPGLPRHAPGRAPDRHDAYRVLPARRRPRLRNVLDDRPRRRGSGLQLRAHGPHRLRAPGAVGGLAPRLAAAMLHHAHSRRPARLAARASVASRTPHRPMAAPGSRTLRQPRGASSVTVSSASSMPGRGQPPVRLLPRAGVYELTPLKWHFRRRCREGAGSGLAFGSALTVSPSQDVPATNSPAGGRLPLSATERTRHRRFRHLGRVDRDSLYAVLDAGLVAHLGVITGGWPMVVPPYTGSPRTP